MTDLNLLVIDDDEDILLSARLYLKQHFKQVLVCKSPKEINTLLSKNEIDLILLDMNYQTGANDGREGLYWLKHILSINPDMVIVLMTAYGHVELAVKAIKEGAYDFVLKPWENEKLYATLSAAAKLRLSNKKVQRLEKLTKSLKTDIEKGFEQIIGHDSSIKSLQKTILKIAPTDVNVLILGENGTGKQVFAFELHQKSARRNQLFVHVDLGSLPENLFESELFGYVKGAFTDAKEDKPGRFEVADGGTIFLDEIGNLSPGLQSKLLSVIQNQSLNRLGENKTRQVDVRIICATNMPLHDMVQQGTFRQDLLFRINTVELILPALRERGEDVLLLADYFLNKFSSKYNKPLRPINLAAREALLQYYWPGNIRELQHVMERAVIMSEGTEIALADLQLKPNNFVQHNNLPQDIPLNEMEKLMVIKAIEKYKGNISKAAAELGLTRAALYRRMEKFGI